MEKKQKTVKNVISLQGRGLHTGNITKITFKPAPDAGLYV